MKLTFMAHRSAPPVLPNYPQYASRACWCKSLETRLEEAMGPIMTMFPGWDSEHRAQRNADAGPGELEYVPLPGMPQYNIYAHACGRQLVSLYESLARMLAAYIDSARQQWYHELQASTVVAQLESPLLHRRDVTTHAFASQMGTHPNGRVSRRITSAKLQRKQMRSQAYSMLLTQTVPE